MNARIEVTPVVGAAVEVHTNKFIREANALPSCELIGIVKHVTARAVLFDGTILVRQSENCHRCGREITNPVSQLCGYGSTCSEIVGVPRDFTPEQIEAVKLQLETANVVENVWLPKSRCSFYQPVESAPVALLVERCDDCDCELPADWSERVCLLCKNEAAVGFVKLVSVLAKRYGYIWSKRFSIEVGAFIVTHSERERVAV